MALTALTVASALAAAEGRAEPLEPGETHHRDLDLEAGEFVHLIVDQLGVDLALELRDPESRLLVRVDAPSGDRGPEELVAIAEVAGIHRLEIRAPEGMAGDGGGGGYRYRIAARRPATAEDRQLVTADRAYHRACRLRREGRIDEAAEVLRGTLPTFRRSGLEGWQAEALGELAEASRLRGDLEIAALFAERAAELHRPRDETLQAAAAFVTSGQIRLRLGQAERASRSLEEAARLYREIGWERGVALATEFLGVAEYELGSVQSALARLEQAVELARSLGDGPLEAMALSDLGVVLLALHRPEEALDGFERAQAGFAEGGSAVNRAIALDGIAKAAVQLGELDRADGALAEALGLLVGRDGRAERAKALRTLGDLRRRRGDYVAGRLAFDEALRLARGADDRRTEGVLLLELGHLETLAGNPGRGLDLHDRALSAFTALGDAKGTASARVRGAQSLLELGRPEEAWKRFAPALEVIESLRSETERGDFRTSYFAFRQDYYEIGIDILMARHRLESTAGHDREAFYLNERRRARDLIDELAVAADTPAPDPELSGEERRIERELADLASKPAAIRGEAERAIEELLARLYAVRGRLRERAAPSSGSSAPQIVNAGRAQDLLLDESSVLLVYALGEERSHLWCLTAEGVETSVLPSRLEIESLAAAFARSVATRHELGAAARRRFGVGLSRLLLAPVADRLEKRRLVVVADGALQRLPFAALPVPGQPERFLVEDHEIVLLPSVTVLGALRRLPAPQVDRPRFAVFADPVYGVEDPRVAAVEGAPGSPPAELTRAVGELGVDPFQRLPYSLGEAQGILAVASGPPHLLAAGFEASRETLSATDLSRFAVLHFATHALLNPRHPELSGLVLSLADAEGHPRDGFLRAFEISRLELDADLVVLSACETGVGRELRGEGMASLARSFFHAGARRVVATLWRVSDQHTATLMVRFYRELISGDRAPAAALRAAQLAALEDPKTRAPYYWAGFTFQGDWQGVGWRREPASSRPARVETPGERRPK